MELQGLGSIKLPLNNQVIQPGQRFLVEVIHRDPSGKAQIRLGGQTIPAILEISVQDGEKFWAKVQKIDENGIVLARDNRINIDKAAQLLNSQGIGRLYIEFGQNKDNSLANLLKQVLGEVMSSQVPSEGKNAPVPSDGKSAQVPSDGKSAQVPSDGKSAPVPSDGKSAQVPSDGKSAQVPSEGKSAPVPSEGKSAPVPSEGKSAPVPSDGKSTQVPSDSKAILIFNEGKSAPALRNEIESIHTNAGKSLNVPENIQNDSGEERIGLTSKEQIASFVTNTVPQWSSLGKDGFMQLFLLFRGLGLDYERRLKNLDNFEKDQIQNLRLELKKSLKGILLSLLAGEDIDVEEKSLAGKIIERLTGQQLLLQGGNSETPFYLLEIPLQSDGELYNQTLALKAARKGKKLDLNHCRLALRAETPNLGELGIEGWMYETQLTLKVFSDNPEYLHTLVEENFAQTREIFSQLGITLHPIAVGPLTTAEDFHRFLKGELREGVDYQV